MNLARNLKPLFFIFTLAFSLNAFGQKRNVSNQTIDAVRQIDSLYRCNDAFGNDIYFEYTKKEIKPGGRDSITFKFGDTAAIRQYCIRKKFAFQAYNKMLQLMIENNFISIGSSGPGDCYECSIKIVFKITEGASYAFIRKQVGGYCYPEDCYWPDSKKSKLTKITDDILLEKADVKSLY